MDDWLYWAIDLLASEFGWAMHDILERVYFDDLFYLTAQINKRKNTEYKMQLAIAQNPHMKDQKTLWRILEQNEVKKTDDQLDVVGFEAFKQTLNKSNRIIVK